MQSARLNSTWTDVLDTGAAGAGSAKDVSKFESPKRSSIPLVVFTGGKDGAGTDTGAGAGADDEVPKESSSRGAAPEESTDDNCFMNELNRLGQIKSS